MLLDEDAAYDAMLREPPLGQLGEAHLLIIRSARKMDAALYDQTSDESGFTRTRRTDFGRLVAGDEIAWWVRESMADLDVLKIKAAEAREALQKLLEDARNLQSKDAPTTYLGLVESVFQLCESNAAQVSRFLDFVTWLDQRDDRGPSILFTYKIWGSTRLADREFHAEPEMGEADQLRICTEWATGLRIRSSTTLRRVILDVSAEIADAMDPESYSGPIHVPYHRVSHRVANAVSNNFVTYLELLRNSCRDLEIEIDKAETLVALFDNEAFWQAFVNEVVTSGRTEETWWDVKQALAMWHATGNAKRLEEQDFCERVAAFANTEGGIFVVGVSDTPPRRVLGVQDVENRIKHIYNSVLSRSDLAPPGIKVREVLLDDRVGLTRSCLVVGIAKSPTVVSVKDEAGRLSYPVRRGPGMVRSDPDSIRQSKQFQKGYDWEFMDHIRETARASGDGPARSSGGTGRAR
ncbi:MAG: ATP-binding protein [Dehalococcoidia bacterium]|nr:MAG: ATP-binding protein [Dehalococcoidia bacterium]